MQNNVILIGTQWGDEGKGKIADLLTTRLFDLVVRYQGGANAGHTVVIGDRTNVFHLIPSGVCQDGKCCVLGNGMVIDPVAFVEEIAGFGNLTGRLFVSSRAHLIAPWHKRLETARKNLSQDKIGTTGRGIGLAYEDKMARTGLRVVLATESGLLRRAVRNSLPEINTKLSQSGEHRVGKSEVERFIENTLLLAPFVSDTAKLLNQMIGKGKSVLFEGAQGMHLDIDHGTYPFVTSSNPTAGGACIGTGVGPRKITSVIGVAKAYTTRVGGGPFAVELSANSIGRYLRATGNEYGASTGRPRRCGWFDAVVVRDAVRVNSLDGLILTKLDVLDGLEKVKICRDYTYHGQLIDSVPELMQVYEQCRPWYLELPGWKKSTKGVRNFTDLPPAAREYIYHIEQLVGVEVKMISTGPERSEYILRPDVEPMWLNELEAAEKNSAA